MNKTIGIWTFEQFHRKKNIGSTRIRADWLIKYWDKAERYVQGKKYETIIFQKVYYPEFAKLFDGLKILDICDGDFLDWACRLRETIEEMDGIICSTEVLVKVVKQMTDKPVIMIPDRLDLDFHKQKKNHQGKAEKVVWFGYAHNQKTIETVLPFLEKHKMELIIISNKPFVLPVQYIGKIKLTNYPWSVLTVNEDIIKGDIVINPTFKYGNWQFKSNNKTITSWALGMPVADTPEDLERFLNAEERKKEAVKRIKEIKDKYQVQRSVKEYKEFIDKLHEKKGNKKV